MGHDQFEEAIPLYAVGALDRQERQALEVHLLTGCHVCHLAVKEYQATAALLPYALFPIRVPEGLRKQVIAAAFQSGPRAEETIASRQSRQSQASSVNPTSLRYLQPALILILAVSLAATGLYAWMTNSQINTEVTERQKTEALLREAIARTASLQQQITRQEQVIASLREAANQHSQTGSLEEMLIQQEGELQDMRRQFAQAQQEITALRRTAAQRDEMLSFLRSTHVKVVSLSGLEQAKSAGAFLLFDPQTKKAFFYAFNLPPLPPGKIYQLWAIVVDKPISAATFAADSGHKSRFVLRNLPDLAGINRFAVSVEPEGGRSQPTGEIYLTGQV